MSEPRVRLFAALSAGEVTPVALCRQAQVRILVREGQARRDEAGRLVLVDALAVLGDGRRHPALEKCYEVPEERARYAAKGLRAAELVLERLDVVGLVTRGARLDDHGWVHLQFPAAEVEVEGGTLRKWLHLEVVPSGAIMGDLGTRPPGCAPGPFSEDEVRECISLDDEGGVSYLGPCGLAGPGEPAREKLSLPTGAVLDHLELVEGPRILRYFADPSLRSYFELVRSEVSGLSLSADTLP